MANEIIIPTPNTNTESSERITGFVDEAISNLLKTNPSHSFDKYKDPTITGFRVFFHFVDNSGLLAPETSQNSALAYFKRLGDTKRYKATQKFIDLLSLVSIRGRWAFKSVTGLSELWNRPHSLLYEKFALNFDMYESLDFRIFALSKLYREITWDKIRKNWLLPENLRQFSMSIFIYDMRTFGAYDTNGSYHKFLLSPNNRDVAEINHMLYEIGGCELATNSGENFLSNVSNIDLEPTTANLSITGQTFAESAKFLTITGENDLSSNFFDVVDSSTVTDVNTLEPHESKYNAIKSELNRKNVITKARKLTTDFAKSKANELLQKATTNLNALYLGNLTGLSASNISDTLQHKQLPNTFSGVNATLNNKQPTTLKDKSLIDKNFING